MHDNLVVATFKNSNASDASGLEDQIVTSPVASSSVQLEPETSSASAPVSPCPYLSVIVPTYRDGDRVEENLQKLANALYATGLSWEIIVIVDGDEETYRHALKVRSGQIQVFGYQINRGKGFALRYGMSLARGELVTFIDSDMEIGPEEIGRMATLLDLYKADIVIGSKRHPLSEVLYPWTRRLQSFCYQTLIRLLFRVKVHDTQTGLKMMRQEVAERVLNAACVKRFAFDLELIALARHFGYQRIIEAPVVINYQFSTTTNLKAVFFVLRDTAAIFYRMYIRKSYDHVTVGRDQLIASLPALFVAD